jgi:hypothetical protein
MGLLYLFTYPMEQGPSWEADWFAASQEIPRVLWNLKVPHRTHKRPPPIPILSQPNPVLAPTSHFLKIHRNIILPSDGNALPYINMSLVTFLSDKSPSSGRRQYRGMCNVNIIIIIFINCNWAVTRLQWLFYMYTSIWSWLLINLHLESGGLHEKNVVATWNLGNHLSIRL